MAISAKLKQRGTVLSVVLFVILVLLFEAYSPPQNEREHPAAAAEGSPVRYSKVIDGDTLDVVNGEGQRIRVRLQGVDALETYNETKMRRQAEYWNLSLGDVKTFGLAAKRALEHQCRRGSLTLYVNPADPVDVYGRTLGYIHADGQDVVEPMLKNGLLETRREPHPRSKRYESLFNHAKSHGAGLFGDGSRG